MNNDIRRKLQTGDLDGAEALVMAGLEANPKDLDLLQVRSFIAFRRHDPATGLAILKDMVTIQSNPIIWRGIASTYEHLGNQKDALTAYLEGLENHPLNPPLYVCLADLLMKMGQQALAVEVMQTAYSYNPDVMKWADMPEIPSDLRSHCRAPADALRIHLKGLRDAAISSVRDRHNGVDMTRVENAIWCRTHPTPVNYAVQDLQPKGLYFPDLRPDPVYARDEFGFVAALEARFEAIRDEVFSNLNIDTDTTPYINTGDEDVPEWQRLDQNRDWGSLHFYANGKEVDGVAERFPVTAAALRDIPHFTIDGKPGEAFISVLKPDTHIPPHYGLTNAGITVHFPLKVPRGDRALRVNHETQDWVEGECLFFDDAFLHEAWNRTDEVRIVLIFEVWHPDLTVAEREAIDAMSVARETWMEGIVAETVLPKVRALLTA